MGFMVKPDAVSAYGSVIEQQTRHIEQAKKYVQKYTVLNDTSGGLLEEIIGTHERVVGKVNGALGRLETLLDSCHKELAATAKFYSETDSGAADRLDKTYKSVASVPGDDRTSPLGHPAPQRNPLITGPEMVSCEAKNPDAVLTPPVAGEAFALPFPDNILSEISSWLSPYSIYAKVCEALNLTDPAKAFAQAIAGDWTAYSKCASAWWSLAQFHSAVGENINTGSVQLHQNWSGNASDQARSYFNQLGKKKLMDEVPDTFTKLQKEYEITANGVKSLSDQISGLFGGMVDDAFWIYVEVQAGGATVETVVGPAVLWSLAAMRCKSFVDKWNKTWKLLNETKKVVARFMAATGVVARLTVTLDNISLPKAYDHPTAK